MNVWYGSFSPGSLCNTTKSHLLCSWSATCLKNLRTTPNGACSEPSVWSILLIEEALENGLNGILEKTQKDRNQIRSVVNSYRVSHGSDWHRKERFWEPSRVLECLDISIGYCRSAGSTATTNKQTIHWPLYRGSHCYRSTSEWTCGRVRAKDRACCLWQSRGS